MSTLPITATCAGITVHGADALDAARRLVKTLEQRPDIPPGTAHRAQQIDPSRCAPVLREHEDCRQRPRGRARDGSG